MEFHNTGAHHPVWRRLNLILKANKMASSELSVKGLSFTLKAKNGNGNILNSELWDKSCISLQNYSPKDKNYVSVKRDKMQSCFPCS